MCIKSEHLAEADDKLACSQQLGELWQSPDMHDAASTQQWTGIGLLTCSFEHSNPGSGSPWGVVMARHVMGLQARAQLRSSACAT